MYSKSGKFLDKLAERSASMGLAARSDLYLADVKPIDSMKAQILVGYDSLTGEPSPRQVEAWVEQRFNNLVTPRMASACVHGSKSCVSLLVSANVPTRALHEAVSMRRLADTAYVDDTTNQIWYVVDNGQQKFLARKMDEDLGSLLQARVERRSRKQASFRDEGITKSAAPMAVVGDLVKFMPSGSNTVLLGTVTKMSDRQATITANGTKYVCDKECILEIAERASSQIGAEKSTLQDYFAKAFGSPEYAAELTSKTSKEQHGLGHTVPSGHPSKRND